MKLAASARAFAEIGCASRDARPGRSSKTARLARPVGEMLRHGLPWSTRSRKLPKLPNGMIAGSSSEFEASQSSCMLVQPLRALMSVRRLWDKSSRPKHSKLPRCGSERSLLWLTTRRSRAGQASTRPSKLVSELKASSAHGLPPVRRPRPAVDGSSFKLRPRGR